MSKKSFVMMEDWTVLLSKLPVEMAGQLVQAMCAYQLTGILDESDPVVAAWMSIITPIMDANNAKHEAKAERMKRNSEPKKVEIDTDIETEIDTEIDTDIETDIEPKSGCVSVSESVSDKEKESSSKEEPKKERRFQKPTVDDVRAYCAERHNAVDPYQFFDFYEAKGWKVGSQPMKDWKACVRTWEKRETARSGTTNRFSAGMMQSDYSTFNEEDWVAN